MKIERVTTGIPGLDKELEGGFPLGSLTLMAGVPGAGKTIACLQFLAANAALGKNCVYFCIEQNPKDILEQAEQFGIDLSKVKIISSSDIKYDSMLGKKPQEITDLIKLLFDLIKRGKYDCIAIDSISSLEIEDGLKARVVVKKMVDGLKKLGITGVLTGEAVESEFSDPITPFMVDGLIYMTTTSVGEEMNRTIEVKKMRKTNIKGGKKSFKFTKNGIKIE